MFPQAGWLIKPPLEIDLSPDANSAPFPPTSTHSSNQSNGDTCGADNEEINQRLTGNLMANRPILPSRCLRCDCVFICALLLLLILAVSIAAIFPESRIFHPESCILCVDFCNHSSFAIRFSFISFYIDLS